MPKEKEEQDDTLVNSYFHLCGDKSESEIYEDCEVCGVSELLCRKLSISAMNGVQYWWKKLIVITNKKV